MDEKQKEILDELRRGRIALSAVSVSGISARAKRDLWILREYIGALEEGYRALFRETAIWRSRNNRVRLADLVRNQWSDDAALGYALIAMDSVGLRPYEVAAALEAMQDAMDTVDRAEAAGRLRDVRDGDAEDEDDETLEAGEMPRVVGPSAEFVPEG